MDEKSFILKGNICYSESPKQLKTAEQGYLVCLDGISEGVFEELPEKYDSLPCYDYGDKLIIPGLVDLHIHAPQYSFRGLGTDRELLDWLEMYAFAEETKYKDLEYARRAYRIFTEDLKRSSTTRACVFATVHSEATELLMDLIEESGISAYVGKVNMDRNAPDELREESAAQSAEDTLNWLEHVWKKYEHIKAILTPRFIPCCSDELMELLGKLQKVYNIPVQSHLSESREEVGLVKELCPDVECYGDAYDRHGLFGSNGPGIMAHCVYSSEAEIERMKERDIFIAHCPQSNANLASGIAPVRRYLEEGIRVGLGTDVAGGTSISMFRAISDCVQMSKLYWRLVDGFLNPIGFEEAFYLATKGGGAFFGNVGSFESGYELDALVLDDAKLRHPQELGIEERLERFIYLADDGIIEKKYVAGREVF